MVNNTSKFRLLVKLGYFSRAVLYFLLGLLALTNREKIAEGPQAAFDAIRGFPAGTVILWIVALGLLGYAIFRFASPLFDIEHNGSDKEGILKRIGHAGSGIGHVVLAYSAYKLATGQRSSGDRAQEVAAGVLSVDLGSVLLGVLGIAFGVAAIMQAKKGITGSFMNRISSEAPSYTRILGGVGFCTRAVIFALIGWSLVQSAWFSDSSEVKTIGEAIIALSGNGPLFTIVAIGLLVFGIFSALLTRWRIVPELQTGTGIPSYRA